MQLLIRKVSFRSSLLSSLGRGQLNDDCIDLNNEERNRWQLSHEMVSCYTHQPEQNLQQSSIHEWLQASGGEIGPEDAEGVQIHPSEGSCQSESLPAQEAQTSIIPISKLAN